VSRTICRVNMTASSTRCSRNSPADAVSRAAECCGDAGSCGAALVLFALLALCGQAQAANPAAIPDMRLGRPTKASS
jgi:hypothetical protein